ncbi:MAG: 2-hydroxyacid dehydrogenase [Candidatus Hydrogenedentes bacterium]|nr:2-hydroxyacid dehydrogenase [Candidatus Hydrogenedentota bacterium]
MRVAVFSSKTYTRRFFDSHNTRFKHELVYLEPKLTERTAVLAEGCDAACVFVNDEPDAGALAALASRGVRLLALRCAGFNHVDLAAAEQHGITVVRVPAYSPHAVAEHTLALMLALNRRIVRAYNRVRDGNLELEGLLGFDFHGRTAGIIGTGKIGARVATVMQALGCRVLAHDQREDPELVAAGVKYTDLPALYRASDVISLHCPLTRETRHLIDSEAIAQMKWGVMLINTSRGRLINTADVIAGLKSGQIGYFGIDVYEEEESLFFSDLSGEIIQDDVFARLLTFPNVLVTGHQAFFTEEALSNIAETTLGNITQFEATGACDNAVR